MNLIWIIGTANEAVNQRARVYDRRLSANSSVLGDVNEMEGTAEHTKDAAADDVFPISIFPRYIMWILLCTFPRLDVESEPLNVVDLSCTQERYNV